MCSYYYDDDDDVVVVVNLTVYAEKLKHTIHSNTVRTLNN
jgi:hypothetical protein